MLTQSAITFEIYVDDDRYAVPTFHLIDAADEAGAVVAAEKILSESIHHRGAELCRDGQRVAGLGSFAMRRLPLETRAMGSRRD